MDENFSNSFDSSITNDYIPIARASVNNEYIDAFLVPGYFSIVKSDEFLKSYVRKRLTHEVFKYGILGSQIQSLTAEERQYVVNTYEEFLTKRINDFKERLTPDLVALCGRSKHDILPFSQDLENLANGNNLKSEYKPINKAIHDFFGELTNETYKFIFDFFQDFNLRFAFEAFIILDNHYTKFVPNANSNKKDFIEKNFKKSIFFTENDSISFRNQIIDNYFEFYFTTNLYNLLTKGNEGVLDNCSAFLTKLIGKIQYKDNWEVEFKLQVQVAKKDLSKIYIPELKDDISKLEASKVTTPYLIPTIQDTIDSANATIIKIQKNLLPPPPNVAKVTSKGKLFFQSDSPRAFVAFRFCVHLLWLTRA